MLLPARLKTLAKEGSRTGAESGKDDRMSVFQVREYYFEGDSQQCLLYCTKFLNFKYSLYSIFQSHLIECKFFEEKICRINLYS